MEIWLLCWNCEHDTPQERMHYEKFYRTQEIFNKEEDGSVRNKYYAPLIASHAFYKCKKCGAPNYYVHEYWPTEKESESATQESIEFHESIRDKGKWDKDKLFHIYHFPTFHKSPIPDWTKELPEDLMRLLWETYAAQKHGLNTLCAMGIRAVIDVFAVSKVGDVGGFAKKLDTLKKDGHISDTQYKTLLIVTDAGNAASHRGFSPTSCQIGTCLAVLEAMFFFEIKNNDLVELKGMIPERGKQHEKKA